MLENNNEIDNDSGNEIDIENEEEHIREFDSNGNEVFICSEDNCKKEFLDLISLKKHKINHGEKQYLCSYVGCLRKFLDNSKLRRHLLVHTVIKLNFYFE